MNTLAAQQRILPARAPYDKVIDEAFARVTPPGMEPLNLFRTMARNPRVLQRMFAGSLLDPGSITLRERELVILRTCARCKSEYEWGIHVRFFSSKAGLSAAQVAATRAAAGTIDTPLMDKDLLLIRLVDALHDGADVPDGLWSELGASYTDEQLLELIVLTGYYHTISFLTNALRITPETYAPRFADDR